MRMKALLALLGVILALVVVTGCSDSDNNDNNQTRTFTVRVLDAAASNAPVIGANVVLCQNGTLVRQGVTNDNGEVIFSDVPFGCNYTLNITGEGIPETTEGPCTIDATYPEPICVVYINQTVTAASIGGTIFGTSDVLSESIPVTVDLYLNGELKQSTVGTPVATEGGFVVPFTFDTDAADLPTTGVYTVVVTPEGGLATTYGPIDISGGSITDINILVQSAAAITALGPTLPSIPTNTTIVVLPPVGSGLTASFTTDSLTSTAGLDGSAYIADFDASAGTIVPLSITIDSTSLELAVLPVADQLTVVQLASTLSAAARKAKK